MNPNLMQIWQAAMAALALMVALARGKYEFLEAAALVGGIGGMMTMVLIFWFGVEQPEDGR